MTEGNSFLSINFGFKIYNKENAKLLRRGDYNLIIIKWFG
ncbi:MAG: hypothetical protein CM15mP118_4620 [Alphaproteobacteria bacterium]|nr:MAG: hypothetical protein CM15mP118_4620 [Alphaproteobacteria bacterium]